MKYYFNHQDAEISAYKEAFQRTIQSIADKAVNKQAEFIEDTIAGLVAAGIEPDQVSIHYHPDLRVTIEVDGVEKYCHQINFNDDSASSLKD